MLWRSRLATDLDTPPQASDLADLPWEAWRDIQESAGLLWKAWVRLFPKDPMWDPVGAGLALTFIIALVIWLIKVRPG